jgi:excisionase family DNA binding protein
MELMPPSLKKYVTSLEAAGLLMVSPVTIREWARKGLLQSVSTAGGHRRFMLDQLQQFARAHGIQLESPGSAPAAEPLRVLLVDDDSAFTGYLREIVRASDSSVDVKSATDGFRAGQLTEGFRPNLVVLDISMPGIDGIELCRRMRADPVTAKSRLVILSGVLSPENIAAARAAGADAWIEKGASRAEILGVLGLGGAFTHSKAQSAVAGIGTSNA